MGRYSCLIQTGPPNESEHGFELSAPSKEDAENQAAFVAIHEGWARDRSDINYLEVVPIMAEDTEQKDSISTFASKDKVTKNKVRYNGGFGALYVPKERVKELGEPETIKIILERA